MQSAPRSAVNQDVWFYPRQGDPDLIVHRDQQRAQPVAAKVVYVNVDNTVNLVLWDHAGRTHFRRSVVMLQSGDAAKGWDFCVACGPAVVALPVKDAA